jgi:hypothetical protein
MALYILGLIFEPVALVILFFIDLVWTILGLREHVGWSGCIADHEGYFGGAAGNPSPVMWRSEYTHRTAIVARWEAKLQLCIMQMRRRKLMITLYADVEAEAGAFSKDEDDV